MLITFALKSLKKVNVEDWQIRRIKELRKKSSIFVREDFYNALLAAIKQYGLDTLCTIEVEQDGKGEGAYKEPLVSIINLT